VEADETAALPQTVRCHHVLAAEMEGERREHEVMAAVAMSDQAARPSTPLVLFITSRAARYTTTTGRARMR
jgi:hypothetical protein